MKVKDFIGIMLITLFLSCMTGLTCFPETLDEFFLASFGAFVFWGGMFSGAIMDCFD